MSPNSRVIIESAKKLGLQAEVFPQFKNYLFISDGQKEIVINETFRIVGDDPVTEAERITKNKRLTYFLWERSGLPVPQSHYLSCLSDLKRISSSLVYPVIVKEIFGSRSINVFPNIQKHEELVKVLSEAKDVKKVVLQEMVFGKEYRLLVYKGKVIAGLNLIPPFIIGDGKNKIFDLINQKNKQLKKKIVINEKVLNTLKKQKLVLDSIPAASKTIFLQNNSCLSEGGLSVECTRKIHPEIKKMAAQAAKLVNLGLGGIDLLCEDISLSPEDQKIVFLEINTWPSLDIHHEPMQGSSIDVAGIILKDIFNLK